MNSINKATILGNVGKDPEIKTFQNGGRVASFSVATSQRWKDKTSGDVRERTEWHRVSVFNENLISVAERFIKKGSKIYLEGQIETRKYTDKDGIERYATEIALRPYGGTIVLLDGKDKETASSQEQAPAEPTNVSEMLDDKIPEFGSSDIPF